MKNKRRNGFLLAILAGLILGLVYGWFINPPGAKNTTLASLRSDYQADYALMVAENFAVDQDVFSATAMLEKISPNDPNTSIRQAMITGQQLGYSEREMQLLSDLESSLSASSGVTP
jgi:hypothetical protein